jgi:TonB family protein
MNVLWLRDDRSYARQALHWRYVTIATVGAVHLGLLYLLWSLPTELPRSVSKPENSIQIRFIQLKKTQQIQQHQPQSMQTPSFVPQRPTVAISAPVAEPSKTEQPRQISSTTSQKNVASKVNIESKPAISQRADPATQPKPQLPASDAPQITKPESKAARSTSIVSASTPSSQVEGQGAEKPSAGTTSQSQQQEQIAVVSTASSPVPVSRVDVLSLGKLNYDDRELHQQQRLLILIIQIDHKGLPTALWVKQSSGILSLDERALKAMKKSKFKPHKINGESVAVVVDFPIQLKLSRNR